MNRNQHTAKASRRRFLKAAGAALATPVVVTPDVVGLGGRTPPSERIQIGFIGSGHRSRLLMSQVPKEGNIVAICDVDLRRCHHALKEKKAKWRVYQNYHELLASKDIDAVIVPTTDHGRVLPCIHSCQAGKDVYAEKPLTLTVREGRALVNAVRKYKRVFQTGTQQRSMEMNRFACEFVRKGGLGKLQSVVGVNYTGPGTCGGLPKQPVPKELDWDMWLSSTPWKPFNERLQRGWMGCRDFSGGEMTNWGAHGLDQVQWALGMDLTGPVEIWTTKEGRNAPVSMRYANGIVVKLEIQKGGPHGGAVFIGEKGQLRIDRNRFVATPAELITAPPPKQKAEIWEGPGWQAKYHIGDWLDCIKTRKLPVADVEIGHRSVSVCHLANIAREVGRKLEWDPKKEDFVGAKDASALLDRPRRKGYELPT